jgi:rubrerythrin
MGLKQISKYVFELDGKRYSIEKSMKNSLLKEWKCPHCGQTMLSYRADDTAAEHIPSCKVFKKKLKQRNK